MSWQHSWPALSSYWFAWSSSLPASGQGDFEQRYTKGVELFQAGKLDPAEQEFVAVIKALPESPEPYFFLEKLYQAKNRLQESGEKA